MLLLFIDIVVFLFSVISCLLVKMYFVACVARSYSPRHCILLVVTWGRIPEFFLFERRRRTMAADAMAVDARVKPYRKGAALLGRATKERHPVRARRKTEFGGA